MATVKFTTSTTSAEKPKPVAVLARQRLDAVVGSVIQIDGRGSYDPRKLPLTWKWRFVQVPIGSELTSTSFKPIWDKSRAVSFIPDVIGIYIIELTVNNGEQDSDPVTAYVSLQISRVPCGENLVPDAHFLWSYISDFWKLVDDRYMVESVWSSVIQIIGSELITLWDTDNNKSINTIQERSQRRWQPFHPVTKLIDEARHRIIAGKTDAGNNATTGVYGEIPTSGSTSVIYTALGEPRDIIASDFTNLKGNYGDRGRIIVVNGEAYTISRTENNTEDDLSLVFTDQVVVPDGQAGVSWRIPHLLHMPDVNLEDVGARSGDVLVFEVTRRDIGLSAELRTQVVGVDRNRLGFEFTLDSVEGRTVESQTGTAGTTSGRTYTHPSAMFLAEGVKPTDTLILEGGVDAGSYQIVSVLSDTQVIVDSEFSGGGSHSHQVLRYNTDSTIDIELFKQLVSDLRLLPPDSTDEEKEAVAKTVVQFIPIGVNLNTRPFTKFKLAFKAKKIIHNTVIEADDTISSVPALQEKVKDPPVVLRENLDYIVEGGRIEFVTGLFTPKSPAPEELWAECVWYDNDGAIENNFGLLVSLKKEDYVESRTRAPYLSAVKGLMYAFTNSSSVSNLRLALQILLGLPFTDERGIVLEIEENFSTDSSGNVLGRILMEDINDDGSRTGVRKFYFFYPELGLEVNRSTGETIKVGDVLERFVPISKGVEVQDYVKTPLWWKTVFSGLEILKYFTFYVAIDSTVFNSDEVTFAVNFVKKIKPAYTNLIAAVILSLEGDAGDDIEIEDSLAMAIVLKFYDNTWGLEATNRADDLNQQGVILNRVGSKPFLTRTPRLLHDVETVLVGSSIRATSATGWDLTHVRGRDDSSDPVQEGDHLHIHPGQPGAGLVSPGIYEIGSVIDANTLELLTVASGPDPSTFEYTALDSDLFVFGSGLTCCIVRRGSNPIIKGTDLYAGGGNTVMSSSAKFLTNGVMPGDHLVIEVGGNVGEYYITGHLSDPPYISEDTVGLLNLDGSVPTISLVPEPQSFRVIRTIMAPRRIEGAKSIWNGVDAQMEVEIADPNNGSNFPFDIFTPAMVGGVINVSGSEAGAVNDGNFQITKYLGPSRVATNSSSTTSDASSGSVVFVNP